MQFLKEMDESLELWKEEAIKYQTNWYNNLGDRVYDIVNDEQLTLKVGYALYYAPSEVDESTKTVSYTKAQQRHIKLICDKVKSLQQSENGMFYISFLYVIFRLRNKKHDVGLQPIIRVPKFVGKEIHRNAHIFLDPKPRIYENWDVYLKKNKLPKCNMCYPTNGVYSETDGTLDLTFGKSPACGTRTRIFGALDVSSTVMLVGGTGVALTSLVVPFAAPIVYGAAATVLASGSYDSARTVYRLNDINKHGESLGLKNPDARSAWLNLASSVVGMASVGAVARGVMAAESGLSRTGILTMRAIKASSLAVTGLGVLNNIVVVGGVGVLNSTLTLVTKRMEGILETKDIIEFIYECLFFLNADVTYNVASILIDELAGMDKFYMKNLFNQREKSPFQFAKSVTKYSKLNSLYLLKNLIFGVELEVNTDDLKLVHKLFLRLLKIIPPGTVLKQNWTNVCIHVLANIWERYLHEIMRAIKEIQSTFDVSCWKIVLPKQISSNLEIPRLMCKEVDRVAKICEIAHSSNERKRIMTLARTFSLKNECQIYEEFTNRFKFYCECIIEQFVEDKTKNDDLILSKALDEIAELDDSGTIDILYTKHQSTQEPTNINVSFLEIRKGRIYSFCGPDQIVNLVDDFYWDKVSDLTGFIVNKTNCSMHRRENFVLIQPKKDQQENEIEAIVINSSFINDCQMGLILLILK